MKKILAVLIILTGALVIATPVRAGSPYRTWTLGPGGFLWETQDAYTPLDQIDLPLSEPEDMFLAPDGSIYVADTGNGRIVQLDVEFQIAAEFGKGILQSPTGVFVDDTGTLYIADSGKNTVIILGSDGSLIKELGRPTEPLFGANRAFLPRKIAMNSRKNLYIVGEGSVDGLIMMNTEGNFIGYFGANAAQMSLKMVSQRMFLSREQLDQFIRNEAASPSNVTIDAQSLVYTITAGTAGHQSIHKFTVSGRNLIGGVYGSRTFRDIHVSANGLMVVIDAEGQIYEYDLTGRLLFLFGGLDRGDQRLGLLSNPTAIERVGDDLYVLDKDKNAIVIYRVTAFAKELHSGVRLHSDGFYEEARPYFEDVLDHNGLILLAYQDIANAEYMDGDYATALKYYRYAEDRGGYSQAFWELRNTVLQRYLGSALGVMLGGWIMLSVFTRVERRYHWLDPARRLGRTAQRFRPIDDFVFMFRFIKKPVDSYYYIKQNQRGSLFFALLLFGWVVVARVLSIYTTGFIFSPYVTSWQIHVETEALYVALPIILWTVANYLVATISNGEGSIRQVFIGSVYSLFPYALFTLPIALFSNLLTLNEIFLFTFSNQLVLFWCGLMLVIMVKEIHNYSISETVRTILATLFTMAMLMLTGYILYVLFMQLYDFIRAIIQEVGLRG
jgi:tetratricopeptide (TPR) repeat protein